MAERTQWIALGGQVFQRNPAGIAGAAQQVQHARDGDQALVQRGPEILPGRRGRRRWGRGGVLEVHVVQVGAEYLQSQLVILVSLPDEVADVVDDPDDDRTEK